MNNRINLITAKLSGSYTVYTEDKIPLDTVQTNSELAKIIAKISKPFVLYKIYNKNNFAYCAEFENSYDALEYALKLNPINHDYRI